MNYHYSMILCTPTFAFTGLVGYIHPKLSKMKKKEINWNQQVATIGFEPIQTEPKSVVLPLHQVARHLSKTMQS